MQLTARNATLADLAELLGKQQSRKLDVVLPAGAIRSHNANIVVDSDEAHIDETGVWPVRGTYVPTALVDEHIAEKLNVPLAYLRRLREQRVDLYDATVNGFLHGGEWTIDPLGDVDVSETHIIPADARSFMLRMFRGEFGDEAGPGVARALLSDRFRRVDNFDVLTAALEGVQAAGVNVEIDGCDLTDRRMYVRIAAPEIAALAPDLLAGYRSPFAHDASHNGWTLPAARRAAEREGMSYAPGTEPVVFAGFVLSNSETGGGAFSLTPRIIVAICRNGLTITRDALRNVHVGGKLDAGIIQWSDDTQRKNLELVTSQTRDAVSTFLDVDYVRSAVAAADRASGEAARQAGRRREDRREATRVLRGAHRGGSRSLHSRRSDDGRRHHASGDVGRADDRRRRRSRRVRVGRRACSRSRCGSVVVPPAVAETASAVPSDFGPAASPRQVSGRATVADDKPLGTRESAGCDTGALR